MGQMGQYCKAYHVNAFRAFPGWRVDAAALRHETGEHNAGEERTGPGDEAIFYLQENFVVTDGIFKDEHVVFADSSDEWKTFCQNELQFRVPD
jgi:hypothetical protein